MHRPREWDEVVTVAAPAPPGGEAHFVVVAPGQILVEDGSLTIDPGVLVAGLRTPPPFRAWAVHRSDGRWGVAVRRIDVVELQADPGGDEIELVWDGVERAVRVDGEHVREGGEELDDIGRRRHATFVVSARRLAGSLWEIAVAPL
jgi:hypothetical protein